ncbi:MAG: hypothetical protein QOH12_194, partial [Solirubrobacteraceae bacterium]|nr:hypothetical protein [Solirubrobacteraceae bacterium]
MRMPWTRRGEPAAPPPSAAPAPAPPAEPAPSPAGWAFLPPLQRTIG